MRLREVGEVIRRIGRPGLAPDPQELAEHRRPDVRRRVEQLPRKHAEPVVQRFGGPPAQPMDARRTRDDFDLGSAFVQQRPRFQGALPTADDQHPFSCELLEVAVL